jgi:hypothetical protein
MFPFSVLPGLPGFDMFAPCCDLAAFRCDGGGPGCGCVR